MRVIAETPAYHREVERFLFAAEASGQASTEIRKSLQLA